MRRTLTGSSHLLTYVVAAGLALMLPATAATAQTTMALSPFFAYQGSRGVIDPKSGGLAFSIFAGVLGVRGSAEAGLNGNKNAAPRTENGEPRDWHTDGDVVLRFGDGSARSTSWVPYLFAGIGRMSTVDSFGIRVNENTRSWGAGISMPVTHSLTIDGEMRQRYTRRDDDKWQGLPLREFRLGLSLRAGT